VSWSDPDVQRAYYRAYHDLHPRVRTNGAERPCTTPSCPEPRWVFSSGTVSAKCHLHALRSISTRQSHADAIPASQARRDRPCVVGGCSSPRHVLASGFVESRCHAHILETTRRSQSKPVLDPESGETVSRSNAWGRVMVIDPLSGLPICRWVLISRTPVLDPETGETVTRTALASRKKVIDPQSGETVSRSTLNHRRRVIDPETGREMSQTALSKLSSRRLTGYADVRARMGMRKELSGRYVRMDPWPTDCQVCHKPIDPSRSHSLDRKDHLGSTIGHEPPMAWTRDHPEYEGPYVLRPEHWICNVLKGARPDWVKK
jgi:hypothetical protein